MDEPPSKLVPYLAKDVPKDDAEAILTAAISGSPFRWYINGTTLKNDWANPTLKEIADGDTTFDKSELVTVLSKNEWYYLIIESAQPIAHPMHLHGTLNSFFPFCLSYPRPTYLHQTMAH